MTDVLNGIETIATIVHWNHSYGWARRHPARPGDTGDIFVHRADCVDDPPFVPGTRVRLRRVTTPKGPRGLGVEIIQ